MPRTASKSALNVDKIEAQKPVQFFARCGWYETDPSWTEEFGQNRYREHPAEGVKFDTKTLTATLHPVTDREKIRRLEEDIEEAKRDPQHIAARVFLTKVTEGELSEPFPGWDNLTPTGKVQTAIDAKWGPERLAHAVKYERQQGRANEQQTKQLDAMLNPITEKGELSPLDVENNL